MKTIETYQHGFAYELLSCDTLHLLFDGIS